MPTFSVTQAAGPGNTAATAKPMGIQLSCDVKNDEAVAGFHPWFSEFIFKRYTSSGNAASDTNGVIVHQGASAVMIDSAQLTKGSTYWYGFYWVDIYGNISAAGTVRSAVYRGALVTDTDQSVIAAPGSLALSQNYQYVDQGDGIVVTSYKATWNAVTGATRYQLVVSVSDTAGGTYSTAEVIVVSAPELFAEFDVVVGKYYKATIQAFTFNGTPGSISTPIGPVQPIKKSITLADPTSLISFAVTLAVLWVWPKVTDVDYDYTEVETSSNGVTWIPATSVRGQQYINILAQTSAVSQYARIRHVDKSGNPTAWFASLSASGGTKVQTTDIQGSAVTGKDESYTTGNSGTFGTSAQQVQTVNVAHGDDANFVFIFASFRLTTGVARSCHVTLETGAGTQFASAPNQLIDNNGYGFVCGILNSPTGNNTNVNLFVEIPAGGGNTVANRRITAVSMRR